jgi:SET domain-containing protein 6
VATELLGQVLVILLRGREAEYKTTLEDDEKLLQAGQLSNRTKMAVQVRLGEKTVLREAIEEATAFAASNRRMRFNQSSQGNSITQGRKAKRSAEETLNPKKRGRFG